MTRRLGVCGSEISVRRENFLLHFRTRLGMGSDYWDLEEIIFDLAWFGILSGVGGMCFCAKGLMCRVF